MELLKTSNSAQGRMLLNDIEKFRHEIIRLRGIISLQERTLEDLYDKNNKFRQMNNELINEYEHRYAEWAKENKYLNECISTIYSSKSWKLMSPMRKLADCYRILRAKAE